MKKTLLFGATLLMAFVLTGCKTSSEEAYRKAYEKAKAQEQPVVETPAVTTPQVEAPVVTTQQEAPATQQVAVRTEALSVVDGKPLLNYSVVVGSYSLQPNATGMAQQLRNAGYEARVAFNSDRNLYRVVATSFNTRNEAVQSRDQLRSKYPDAWLLYQK